VVTNVFMKLGDVPRESNRRSVGNMHHSQFSRTFYLSNGRAHCMLICVGLRQKFYLSIDDDDLRISLLRDGMGTFFLYFDGGPLNDMVMEV